MNRLKSTSWTTLPSPTFRWISSQRSIRDRLNSGAVVMASQLMLFTQTSASSFQTRSKNLPCVFWNRLYVVLERNALTHGLNSARPLPPGPNPSPNSYPYPQVISTLIPTPITTPSDELPKSDEEGKGIQSATGWQIISSSIDKWFPIRRGVVRHAKTDEDNGGEKRDVHAGNHELGRGDGRRLALLSLVT